MNAAENFRTYSIDQYFNDWHSGKFLIGIGEINKKGPTPAGNSHRELDYTSRKHFRYTTRPIQFFGSQAV